MVLGIYSQNIQFQDLGLDGRRLLYAGFHGSHVSFPSELFMPTFIEIAMEKHPASLLELLELPQGFILEI